MLYQFTNDLDLFWSKMISIFHRFLELHFQQLLLLMVFLQLVFLPLRQTSKTGSVEGGLTLIQLWMLVQLFAVSRINDTSSFFEMWLYLLFLHL